MSVWSNLFNPKQVLVIIANDIEKQTKIYITKYVMIYDSKRHLVSFRLNDEKNQRPLNEPALADGIRAYISTHVQDGFTLEYAFIFFHRNSECKLAIHLIDANGNKSNEEINL